MQINAKSPNFYEFSTLQWVRISGKDSINYHDQIIWSIPYRPWNMNEWWIVDKNFWISQAQNFFAAIRISKQLKSSRKICLPSRNKCVMMVSHQIFTGNEPEVNVNIKMHYWISILAVIREPTSASTFNTSNTSPISSPLYSMYVFLVMKVEPRINKSNFLFRKP